MDLMDLRIITAVPYIFSKWISVFTSMFLRSYHSRSLQEACQPPNSAQDSLDCSVLLQTPTERQQILLTPQ